MAMTMSKQKKKKRSKKEFGGKRQSDIFHFFSSASEPAQTEGTRLHVQLSNGICLWFFSCIFFSVSNTELHHARSFSLPNS